MPFFNIHSRTFHIFSLFSSFPFVFVFWLSVMFHLNEFKFFKYTHTHSKVIFYLFCIPIVCISSFHSQFAWCGNMRIKKLKVRSRKRRKKTNVKWKSKWLWIQAAYIISFLAVGMVNEAIYFDFNIDEFHTSIVFVKCAYVNFCYIS